MNEDEFQKIALVVLIIGGILLGIVVLIQQPVIATTKELPQNDLVRFNATLQNYQETPNGIYLQVERNYIETIYFQSEELKEFLQNETSRENESEENKNERKTETIRIEVKGRLKDGFFNTEEVKIR